MFIVPVNYGYDLTEGQLTLYLHSAREGRKAAAFRRGGAVAFEMDCGHRLVGGETPCGCSMDYASVIGYGTAEVVREPEEKLEALALITGRFFDFPPQTLAAMEHSGVMVLKVTGDTYTAKQRGTQF